MGNATFAREALLADACTMGELESAQLALLFAWPFDCAACHSREQSFTTPRCCPGRWGGEDSKAGRMQSSMKRGSLATAPF